MLYSIVQSFAGFFLVCSPIPMPDRMYSFLRWYVSGIAAFEALASFRQRRFSSLAIWACILVTYNPILPLWLC
jgi:hypothetical protein